MKPIIMLVLAAAVVATPAAAQVVDPGMNWSGSSGTYAGTACGAFTCTPFHVAATVGESVTVQVRGTYQHSYAIGLSSSASQCLAIPGVVHNLVLDLPVSIALTGVLSQGDPILVCPGGRIVLNFVFPFMPSGTSFSIQALSDLPNGTPALTSAITVTVL